MQDGAIESIAQRLEADGHDAGTLHELQHEIDTLEQPPGFFGRMSRKASDTAKRQWAHIMGELQESKEAMAIVSRAISRNEKLSGVERDKVREQMLDIIRVFPASLIAAANAALPLPGSSMATPWLLNRLGIMPSRWREAHIIDSLETEITRLKNEGLEEEAAALDAVKADIEHEANEREQVAREAALLTFWDTDNNGILDDEERAAYRSAVRDIADLITESAHRKCWFLLHEDTVLGPLRLQSFDQEDLSPELLLCYEGKSGWVALQDVLAVLDS